MNAELLKIVCFKSYVIDLSHRITQQLQKKKEFNVTVIFIHSFGSCYQRKSQPAVENIIWMLQTSACIYRWKLVVEDSCKLLENLGGYNIKFLPR